MVNGDVNGNAEVGVDIAVGRRERVRQIRGVVRREGGGVAGEHFDKVRSIVDGRVVKRPVGFWNRPLIPFAIDGENLRLERVVCCDVKVLPCRNFAFNGDAEGLCLAPRDIDDHLREFGFVPGFKNL